MASTSNEEGQVLKKHIITTLVIETIEVNGYELQDRKHQVIIKASENRPRRPKSPILDPFLTALNFPPALILSSGLHLRARMRIELLELK